MDIQSLKNAINTPHTQYPEPLDTNPATLQQQLSKMKENIKHLQQMKRPNVYLTLPGNYRSFCTTDGLVICRRCNQVGHFACICQGNLPPPRSPTHYQNHQHNYVPPDTSQYPQPSHTPNRPSNQYSQRPSQRSHTNQHDTMCYPNLRNANYTNPSRRPPFSSADQTDSKYQARRSNIPGQNNTYSNVIQNHALKDRQCLVSGTLDQKPTTMLIDTGSSISLLDEELYCLLSFSPPLQPIQFSVSGADDMPLMALAITSLSIAIDDNTFQGQLVVTRNIHFPVVLGIDFLQHTVELSVFQLTSYTSLAPLPNPPTSISTPIPSTIHTHHPCMHPSHTIHTPAWLLLPNPIM